ncbi:MAG: [LysW]-aminoadipate kinase [Planctomycetota bacterium]
MTTRPVVVKIGGAEGNDAVPLLEDLRARVVDGGERIVVVHGGSGETDRLAHALGRPPRTLVSPQGHESRDVDRDALETFAMATALVNRRLVESARGLGLDAFGLSGLDGGIVRARRKEAVRAVVDGRDRIVRDQWTGRVIGVRAEILRGILARDVVPFVAPLAAGEGGEMLNVDGDRLAAALAVALDARALVILSNVEGLRADPADPASTLRELDLSQLDLAHRAAAGRMKRKVLAVEEALLGGVPRAIIASSAAPRPLSTALAGGGTQFRRAPAEQEMAR